MTLSTMSEPETPKDALKRTWAVVARDLEGAGVQLFKEVFSSAHGPGKSYTFAPGKSMFDSPKLREHGVKVMETIGKAISSIDNPAKLKPVLMSLGKTHAMQHNVKDNQYDMIAAALIATLEKRLGSAWTPSVAAAWGELYQDVASDMKEGAAVESIFVPNKGVGAPATDDGLPPSQETPSSENGLSSPQETPASQELKRIWALLKEQGLEKVGISLFKGVFSTAPSILMLFPFRDELDVYESAALKSHALRVMEALGQVVESSDNLSAIKPMLRTLGQKHVQFKIKEQHYAIFGKALLGALEMHLGDQWTAESISSWENLVKDIASSMQEGATCEATQLVQRTWKAVEEQGLEENGVRLFREIFTAAPAALQLFPFRDELDIYSSPALKTHALGVMKTVGTAVSMLDDLPALVPVLKDLGAKHVKYGVKDAHYPIVGKALLTTLEKQLGDLWTEDVKTAWTGIVKVVADTMKEGAVEGPAAAAPTNETANQAVVRTWKMVEEQGLEENGVKLFKEIFATAPGALQLFPFKDELDVYGSPALKTHALGVMKTVGTAVSMLDDLSALVPVLKDLGAKHLQYGVKDAHYNVVAKAFFSTLEAQLGPAWTDPVASAWKETFEVVAATMKEGAMEIPVQSLAVQRTWKEVQKQGLEANGVLLFKEIFTAAPGALQLFPFKDELDVYNSPALKTHALGVMETVGTAVSMLDDLPALVPVLKDLGAKHVKYGVKDAHYSVVGKALLTMLEKQLGSLWTAEVQSAWVHIFDVVSTNMKQGAAATNEA